MKTVLVTGAAGFIGPQVVKFLLLQKDTRVIAFDKLTYAGNRKNLDFVLREVEGKGVSVEGRYEFIHGDICDLSVKGLIESRKVNRLFNLAAESHVDRSIGDAPDFLRTEMQGALNLLEIIRTLNNPAGEGGAKIEKALFVGTDEVYGSIDRNSGCEGEAWYTLTKDEAALRAQIHEHLFTEDQRLMPGSPYSSTKAGADQLVVSYFNTCRDKDGNPFAPIFITRGVNNFGPFQHPEKLLPMAICTLLKPRKEPDKDHCGYRRRIPIYDRGLAVREWLHTEDHATAMLTVAEKGTAGELYNVGSGNRCLNRDILIAVFKAVGDDTPFSSLAEAAFNATGARPGHDLCYGADASKTRGLGWEPVHVDLEAEIASLVQWHKDNRDWWEPIWDSADFETYWQSKYGKTLTAFGDGPFEFYTEENWNRPLQEALL
jgi:dTDP-glucose 4,6-dehydratase